MANLSVTSCTVSRSVLTTADTIDVTMTIKNTKGVKISKFGLALAFTNEDLGYSGNGWWAPVVQQETSVSWASNASKTFTWSICPDTVMSPAMYAYNYQRIKNRLDELRALPFRVTFSWTGSDGSGSSEIYTLSGVQYIDAYYNPQIVMDIWRYPDDESTSLAATMKVSLAEGVNASGFNAVMYCAQDAIATTSSSVLSMNVSRDVLFGEGYTEDSDIIPGSFNNGSVFSFLLVVSDGIETASAQVSVDRAFANMHLSGKRTGGVAFGKFSASSEGNPIFENEFPAVFSSTLSVGGSASFRGGIANIRGGTLTGLSIASGGSANRTISYGVTFNARPFVNVTIFDATGANNLSKCSCYMRNITTSSFEVYIHNTGSSTHPVGIMWMAYGVIS